MDVKYCGLASRVCLKGVANKNHQSLLYSKDDGIMSQTPGKNRKNTEIYFVIAKETRRD